MDKSFVSHCRTILPATVGEVRYFVRKVKYTSYIPTHPPTYLPTFKHRLSDKELRNLELVIIERALVIRQV